MWEKFGKHCSNWMIRSLSLYLTKKYGKLSKNRPYGIHLFFLWNAKFNSPLAQKHANFFPNFCIFLLHLPTSYPSIRVCSFFYKCFLKTMVNRSLCRQRHDFPERAVTIDDSFFQGRFRYKEYYKPISIYMHNHVSQNRFIFLYLW